MSRNLGPKRHVAYVNDRTCPNRALPSYIRLSVCAPLLLEGFLPFLAAAGVNAGSAPYFRHTHRNLDNPRSPSVLPAVASSSLLYRKVRNQFIVLQLTVLTCCPRTAYWSNTRSVNSTLHRPYIRYPVSVVTRRLQYMLAFEVPKQNKILERG